MTKTKNALFALPVLAAILVGGTISPAFAGVDGTFICDGLVEDQTIDANVLVPRGESCIFDVVTVNGNMTVERDADFSIISGNTHINGNLDVKGANSIDLTELRMNGNISIMNSGNVVIAQATVIEGNVSLKGNDFVRLFEQSITGNVSIIHNDEVHLADVGIDGNLKILKNGPVTGDFGDFGVGVLGNATCLKNESITGEFFVGGNNNGCPIP